MSAGYAAVGLSGPKDAANVGAVLRAAGCYGVVQVNIENPRHGCLKAATNTPKSHQFIPTFATGDVLDPRPVGCDVVAVEILDDAVPLPEFRHPARALYVFGPEDGSLASRITDRAQHVVFIPTTLCMNLAATVNVVLYDRLVKRGWGSPRLRRAA